MQLPLIGKKVDPRTPWVLGLISAGLLAASTGTYLVVQRATPKSDISTLTVPVEAKNITVRITASGTVVPVQSVNLSPKTVGRLAKLSVEQGDKVEQGQIIARMDSADLEAQLVQAKANLDQARAKLALLQAGSRPEEIAQARARVAQAQAQLTAAQTSSPEEIAQAKAQVEAAQARLDLASARVRANQSLAQQGAISKDKLREVLTEERTASANLQEAQRRLTQIKSGTNPGDIAQRKAALNEARQALELLENGSRKEDIAQAAAVVAEARGRVQAIQVQLEDTVIRAPFSGIVTQKYATEGAIVTPTTSASSTSSATSTSIVAIAKGVEVLAKVPEVDIGQIKQGQSVEIVADAYPDQVFKGRVRLIAPEAVVDQNVTSFQVRVTIDTGKEELRSGMNVDLTFLGQEKQNSLVVPTVSIVTEKGQTGVLIPGADNKPQFRPVTIGPTIQNQTQILEGIKEGDRVFIDLPKDYKPKKDENG